MHSLVVCSNRFVIWVKLYGYKSKSCSLCVQAYMSFLCMLRERWYVVLAEEASKWVFLQVGTVLLTHLQLAFWARIEHTLLLWSILSF